MKAILVTGRTLGQGLGLEMGKFSDIYYRNVATCEMNRVDMERLGVKEGELIRVSSGLGSAVLRVVKSFEEVPSGIIFVPYGPWINRIMRPETHGTGMPSFKGIEVEVEVEASRLSEIPKIDELLSRG
ncbi:MAG: molybdopterin dinucleotide binding domain-containing protein [Candidatus Bathyarchaeia archaeon]|nr:protein fwdD [Candidatus Bathyarchaeota archaeon]